MTPKRNYRRIRGLAFLSVSSVAVISLAGGLAAAQTWNGSVSDLWGTAGNWTPNTVPNNSTADVTVTNDLTVGAGNSVSLENGQLLSISGSGASNLAIQGTLSLNSTGAFTDLALSGRRF
jgi:autotransporter family porin